jgi:hypothetical protein
LQNHPTEISENAIEYLSRIAAGTSKRIEILLKKAAEQKFVALGHGDCWNNNMLFKIDPQTGKATKNVLVDLQVFKTLVT